MAAFSSLATLIIPSPGLQAWVLLTLPLIFWQGKEQKKLVVIYHKSRRFKNTTQPIKRRIYKQKKKQHPPPKKRKHLFIWKNDNNIIIKQRMDKLKHTFKILTQTRLSQNINNKYGKLTSSCRKTLVNVWSFFCIFSISCRNIVWKASISSVLGAKI